MSPTATKTIADDSGARRARSETAAWASTVTAMHRSATSSMAHRALVRTVVIGGAVIAFA
jgi:hypothetical protein